LYRWLGEPPRQSGCSGKKIGKRKKVPSLPLSGDVQPVV